MSDLHVEEFYKDTGKSIVNLYAVFPRPVTLFVEDISGPDEPDEYGVHSVRHQACFATLIWLGEEGFMRFQDTIRQDAVDQAVMTAACFAALTQPMAGLPAEAGEDLPASVRAHQRTRIFQLQRALKSRSSDAVGQVVSDLLESMQQRRR